MALSSEQKALIKKGLRKLMRKVDSMKSEYAAAETRAKTNYSLYPWKKTRKDNYEAAWKTMPASYSEKVGTDTYFIKWVIDYADKMFGETLSESEAKSIVSEVEAELRRG